MKMNSDLISLILLYLLKSQMQSRKLLSSIVNKNQHLKQKKKLKTGRAFMHMIILLLMQSRINLKLKSKTTR